MLIVVVIVAFIVVVDIAAITVAGKADKHMELERPDLIDIN